MPNACINVIFKSPQHSHRHAAASECCYHGPMIWAPRVTVACVAYRDGRFLMVEEDADGARVYNQPAGHLEAGESLLSAVTRETLEETGLHFHPTDLVGIYRWVVPETDTCYLRFCFTGAVSGNRRTGPLDPAIRHVLWLSRPDLEALAPQLRSPLVLRCIDDYLSGHRYDLALLKELA